MGSNKIKTTDMTIGLEEADKIAHKGEEATKETKVKEAKQRSKKYTLKRGMVDRTKFYALAEAVDLLKKTSYSSFAGTISADIIAKDEKVQADFSFPHSTGKTKRVAIVTDSLLEEIAAGKIDFDILVTEPAMMPKLAKFARVLGPKGLMPNPKNGTVTNDTAKKAKELEGGKQVVKTEKKSPLMHVVVGKTTMKEAEIVENIEALIRALNPKRLTKLVVSATMSPGIKVDMSPYIVA